MIDRLTLQNIGPFVSLELPLERFTLLVGPNGAGKSTVLRAMELASRWHTGGFEPRERRRIIRQYRDEWLGEQEVWLYPKTSFETFGIPRSAAEAWSITLGSGAERWWVARAGLGTPEIAYGKKRLLTTGALESADESGDEWERDAQGLDSNDPSWFQSFRYSPPADPALPRALRLQLDRRSLAAPSVPSGERTLLGSDGSGLPSVLAEMDREVLEQIEASLARVVPQARRVRPRSTRVRRLGRRPFAVGDQAVQVPVEEDVFAHRLELEIRGSGNVPAELLSEGTLFALGLITAIHYPNRPDLLLIDDLDRGLHLSAQVQVVEILQALLKEEPKLQVLGTTHSPFQLEGVGASQVAVFGLRADGTATARTLTEHPEFERWSRALRTAELWADLGEDWVTEPKDGA